MPQVLVVSGVFDYNMMPHHSSVMWLVRGIFGKFWHAFSWCASNALFGFALKQMCSMYMLVAALGLRLGSSVISIKI